jgi:hypothetical protein
MSQLRKSDYCSYRKADGNECDTLVGLLLGALVYGPRKKEFALNIGSLPIETQEQLLKLIDEVNTFL